MILLFFYKIFYNIFKSYICGPILDFDWLESRKTCKYLRIGKSTNILQNYAARNYGN